MGEFPPNTKAILKLAKYFEVLPHNLLEDGEKMPEFPIGQSDSIDFASIKKEVLISINILSSQNVIHDIYRHTFVKYNDSMLEDLLNISLEITNIYCRLLFPLHSKELPNLSCYRINYSCFNYAMQLKFIAHSLFNADSGLFNNHEINNLAKKIHITCNKDSLNLIYTIEASLINIFHSYEPDTTSPLHQAIICEHILLQLLNHVGDSLPTNYVA